MRSCRREDGSRRPQTDLTVTKNLVHVADPVLPRPQGGNNSIFLSPGAAREAEAVEAEDVRSFPPHLGFIDYDNMSPFLEAEVVDDRTSSSGLRGTKESKRTIK
jgi:hypothetical protein